MRKKFAVMGFACILLALMLFALSFLLFHYVTDSGFTPVWQPEAGKPFVTELVANLGVLFLFGGIISLLTGHIFCEKE